MTMPRSEDYDDYFDYEEAMYAHLWGVFGPLVVIAALVLAGSLAAVLWFAA